MLSYKFGMDEITTKLRILQEEFRLIHSYNPIEHVSSRLKTPESVLDKVRRKGCEPTFERIREEITDIAGVRVTCSFVSDAFRVFDLLTGQRDVDVVTVKDYISNPKDNGYRSLHAIVEIPVFLSAGPTAVRVEVQFRTIAMDFWASLEHKIYYKYDKHVPGELLTGLREAAVTAAKLDEDMEELHREIHGDRHQLPAEPSGGGLELSEEVVVQLLRQRAALRAAVNTP
ncbi:GTP pyrophosphokinase family protein [Phytoactinopolyspora limicola]|uniref:GTP pyrophosphokinase family protein n=1 Tax=Phytoactinopolyspora limicola TaxID=2715536 RepID=UPI00140B6FE6